LFEQNIGIKKSAQIRLISVICVLFFIFNF